MPMKTSFTPQWLLFVNGFLTLVEVKKVAWQLYDKRNCSRIYYSFVELKVCKKKHQTLFTLLVPY